MKSNYNQLSDTAKKRIKELLALNELSKSNILEEKVLITSDIKSYEPIQYDNSLVVLINENLDENIDIFETLEDTLIIYDLGYDNIYKELITENKDSRSVSKLIFEAIIEVENKELIGINFKTNVRYLDNRYIEQLYQILALGSLRTKISRHVDIYFKTDKFSSIYEAKEFDNWIGCSIIISNPKLDEDVLEEFASSRVFVVHDVASIETNSSIPAEYYFLENGLYGITEISHKIFMTLGYILMTKIRILDIL